MDPMVDGFEPATILAQRFGDVDSPEHTIPGSTHEIHDDAETRPLLWFSQPMIDATFLTNCDDASEFPIALVVLGVLAGKSHGQCSHGTGP